MTCEFQDSWDGVIHRALHTCGTAMAQAVKATSEEHEAKELSALSVKIMESVTPIIVDVPKYRIGLVYYAFLGALGDMLAEHSRALDKAQEHCEKTGGPA